MNAQIGRGLSSRDREETVITGVRGERWGILIFCFYDPGRCCWHREICEVCPRGVKVFLVGELNNDRLFERDQVVSGVAVDCAYVRVCL